MLESLKSLDTALFFLLNGGAAAATRPPWLDELMLLVSSRITWLVVAIAIVAHALFRRSRQRLELCLLVGIAIGVSDAVTYQILKPTFVRERPCHQLEGVRLVQPRCGGDYGFPSNHAANSMATAVMVALVIRRQRAAAALVATAGVIGLSRIYLGVHFPADVTAGFVVGALLALALHAAYMALRKRLVPEPARHSG